jgi:hypothetical protein
VETSYRLTACTATDLRWPTHQFRGLRLREGKIEAPSFRLNASPAFSKAS